MQSDHDKAILTAAKSGQTQPRTQVGDLRDLLTTIERRIAKLKEITPEDALEILSLFDEAESRLKTLENAGVSANSEVAHMKTLLMQFRKRGSLFVSRAGGPSAMRQARRDHQPDEDHWWWFIDETLAKERKSRLLRWAAGILALFIVLVGMAFIYQRFLAPDPAFTASYGLQQDSENALMEGDLQLALEKVNEALTFTPDNFELHLLQGIVYLALDDPALAEESFAISKKGFENDEIFYIKRAGLYVILERPDLAIEDTNLVIVLNPETAYAYIYRGQAHELLGDITSARADYELAGEIAERTGNPEVQVVARLHLAQILQQVVPSSATETP